MSRVPYFLLLVVCVALLSVGVLGVSNTQHETDVRTPPAAQQTLALLQSRALLQSHSSFFAQLRARGHQLTFVVAGEEAIKLEKYGTVHYDNLLLLAPGAEELGEGASTDAIQRFIDAGRSVLLVADAGVSEPIRELAAELGIDIDEDNTRVLDHASFAAAADENDDSQHDLVRGVISKRGASFVSSDDKNAKDSVLFRGVGHTAQASQLLTPILSGSASAYSAAPGALSEYPAAAGSDVLLVSAVQTRGNARVVFSGSLDLFSNELLHRGDSGNEAFVRELAKWCFNERGLLRARNLTHFKHGAEHDVNPQSYRVQDNIHFSLVIEEYDGVAHAWRPFVASDVQLEFTMLDPYIRLTLGAPTAAGVYSADFQVPDVYGVYKFVVTHRRAGLSFLDVASQVSVHPFRHDEFERFIGQAYPYYTAAFTLMAAFFTFGIVFLYHKD